jgi:N-acetyl-beta-hexosaminidase
VVFKAKTAQGLFYGCKLFAVITAEWKANRSYRHHMTAPAVSITDEPRFYYRGIMLATAATLSL